MSNPYAQTAHQLKTRDAVALEYAPLVKRVALRLAARLPNHLELDDLIQAGMLGLLDAIEKFDPTREAQFRTYAEQRIRGAILDDLRATNWVPRSVRESADQISRTTVTLRAELKRQPREEEIARRLSLSLRAYQQKLMKARTIPLLSMETLARSDGDDGTERHPYDMIKDERGYNPQETYLLQGLKSELASALDDLPERERLVLSLYYDEELNLKEIGEVLGVTESRVCQLRVQAIARLRGMLEGQRGCRRIAGAHSKTLTPRRMSSHSCCAASIQVEHLLDGVQYLRHTGEARRFQVTCIGQGVLGLGHPHDGGIERIEASRVNTLRQFSPNAAEAVSFLHNHHAVGLSDRVKQGGLVQGLDAAEVDQLRRDVQLSECLSRMTHQLRHAAVCHQGDATVRIIRVCRGQLLQLRQPDG